MVVTLIMREYVRLVKPGIVRGNVITASAGFFLASQGIISWGLFVSMVLGLSFVIASACVFNNYIDQDIDALMERTQKRALVVDTIPSFYALVYASVFLVMGTLTLSYGTTSTATITALFGFFMYVVIYSMWAKRHTEHATIIGALSGAVPPVVGYTAVIPSLDTTALLLFIILVTWQMPHFLAIALFRKNEYAAANIPVVSLTQGTAVTQLQMLVFSVLFGVATTSLYIMGVVGEWYAFGIGITSFLWSAYALYGFVAVDTVAWARKMFFMSLIILLWFSILISIDWV